MAKAKLPAPSSSKGSKPPPPVKAASPAGKMSSAEGMRRMGNILQARVERRTGRGR